MARILERRNDITGRVSLDIPVELRDTTFEDSFEAECVNLSTGGLSLRSACLPDVGSTLECRFSALDQGTLVAARGEVVWAHLDGGRSGEFGLRFVDIAPTTELLIEEMLADYCVHRPAQTGDGQAPVVQLELEGTSEAITAQVARDGKGMATFEQKLDLLQLGRAIRARQLHGRERHGEIASVELKLVGNTPMLAVTVDFEPREYGELDLMAAPPEPEPGRDTEPDLQAPGSLEAMAPVPALDPAAPVSAPASPLDRFSHTTETEFARPSERSRPAPLPAEPPVATRLPAGPPVATRLPAEPPVAMERLPAEPPVATERLPAEPSTTDLPAALAEPEVDAVAPDCSLPRESTAPLEPPPRAAEPPSEALWCAADDAGEDESPELILEPPRPAQRLVQMLRRAALQLARSSALMMGVLAGLAERNLPRLRAVAIRSRRALAALYHRHLATGVGALRRLLAQHLPRRRRRTAGKPSGRGRGRTLDRMRPLAMVAMGLSAAGLAVYALVPTGGSEIALHRPVAPAKPPPPRPSAESAIAVSEPSPVAAPESAAVGPAKPAKKSVAAPAEPPVPPGLLFGQSEVPQARHYTLRMSAPVEKLKGIPDKGGFTVIIPGSLSLDRAGPISTSHRAVRRSMILNKGDRSELTIRFAEGKRPSYQVRASGSKLEIRIQDV